MESSANNKLAKYLQARKDKGLDGRVGEPQRTVAEEDAETVEVETQPEPEKKPRGRTPMAPRAARTRMPEDVASARDTLQETAVNRARYLCKVFAIAAGRSERHLFDIEGLTEEEYRRIETLIKDRLEAEGKYPEYDETIATRSQVYDENGKALGKSVEHRFVIPGRVAARQPIVPNPVQPVAPQTPWPTPAWPPMPFGPPWGGPGWVPQPSPAQQNQNNQGTQQMNEENRVLRESLAKMQATLAEQQARADRERAEEKHARELATIQSTMAAQTQALQAQTAALAQQMAEHMRRSDERMAALLNAPKKDDSSEKIATAIAAIAPLAAGAVAAFVESAKARGQSEAESRREMLTLFQAVQSQNATQLQTVMSAIKDKGGDQVATANLIASLSQTSLNMVGAMGEIVRAQMESSGGQQSPLWERMLEQVVGGLTPVLGAFATGLTPATAARVTDAEGDEEEEVAADPQKQLPAPAPKTEPAQTAAVASAKKPTLAYPGFVRALRKHLTAQDAEKSATAILSWFQASRMAEEPESVLAGFGERPAEVTASVLAQMSVEKSFAEKVVAALMAKIAEMEAAAANEEGASEEEGAESEDGESEKEQAQ